MSKTTTYTTKKAAELAKRLADQQAEHERNMAALQAEQEAHDKRLDEALKSAGPARVALVEDLLEKFGVEPAAQVKRRNKRTGEVITGKDGKPVMVDPDPDETERMARLADAIDAAVNGSGMHRVGQPQANDGKASAATPKAVSGPVGGTMSNTANAASNMTSTSSQAS